MSYMLTRLRVTLAAFVFFGFSIVPALADDSAGVARISLINGNVTIQRGDSGDTIAAAVNAPVMVGDYLSTNSGARSEVQFGNADFLRVDSGTQLRFTKLDPTDNQMQLAAGTVELRTLQGGQANPQLDTPSIGVRPDEPGIYRVTVTNDGNTLVTVRSGRADLVSPQGTQTISAGTSVVVSGSSGNPQVSSMTTVAYDNFDEWNSQRDQYVESTVSDRYANSDIVGLDDLGSYGHWVDNPDYGNVWVPSNVGSDWAPYQNGRWVWEPYYGWTWVAYEPWGWAPYHYGRWFYAQPYGWAWYPGPTYVAPVWQPAYVAFFGFSTGGFSLSLAFGNVGWVPLAPSEPYYPWYRGGNVTNITNVTNVTNVTNITNVYNITNIYKNAGKPGGCNVVASRNFAGGKYHYLPVHPDELHNVALAKGPLPIVPTHNNLRFNDKPVAPVKISPRFNHLPLPIRPVPFEQQRQGVQTATERLTQPHAPVTKVGALPTRVSGPTSKTSHSTGLATAGGRMQLPAGISAARMSPWNRFAASRGETGSATTAVTPKSTIATKHIPTGPTAAGGRMQLPAGISAARMSPWDRFAASRGETVAAKPTVASGAAPATQHAVTERPVTRPFTPAEHVAPSSAWTRFGNGSSPAMGAAASSGVTRANPTPVGPREALATHPLVAAPVSAWSRFGSASPSRPVIAHDTAAATHGSTSETGSRAQVGGWNRFPATSVNTAAGRTHVTNSAPSYQRYTPTYSAPRYSARPTYTAPHYSTGPASSGGGRTYSSGTRSSGSTPAHKQQGNH